jgi:hypothetical protein
LNVSRAVAIPCLVGAPKGCATLRTPGKAPSKKGSHLRAPFFARCRDKKNGRNAQPPDSPTGRIILLITLIYIKTLVSQS